MTTRAQASMSTRQRRSRGRTGFTLIEVLVVLALIIILMAFLFPVFAQARDKARQACCMNNLQQLALGMRLYSEENDTLFPPVLTHEDGEKPLFPMTWMARLQPTLRSTAVLIDPSSGHPNPDWHRSADLMQNYSFAPSERAAGRDAQVVWAEPFGTAMWEGLGGFSGTPIGDYRQPVPSRSEAQVARPAETILICDHLIFDWGLGERQLYYPAPRHLREPDLKLPDGRTAPEGRINAAFVDGHVKALRHEQFWAILPVYSRRGEPTADVFKYFWPYE